VLSSHFAFLIRAFREDCRDRRSYTLRLVVVGLIFFQLLFVQFVVLQLASLYGAPGLWFFHWITSLNQLGITLAGIFGFSSAITEEKIGQTLGLLRLTGMTPMSILLGKSTARIIGAMLILSVQFPFTFLAVTLGGVTPHQILAVYVALLAFLIFVGNLGVLCSVIGRRPGIAAILTLLLLGASQYGFDSARLIVSALEFSGLIPSTGLLAEGLGKVLAWGSGVSTVHAIEVILASTFTGPIFSFHVFSNLFLSGCCFVAASLLFERFAGTMEIPTAERVVGLPKKRRSRGYPPGRAWSNRSALAWKDFHFLTGGTGFLILRFAIYTGIAGLVAVVTSGPRGVDLWQFGVFTSNLMSVAMGLELAYLASKIFAVEVRDKTITSLALLPYSMGEIIRFKILGCLMGALPAFTFFALGVILHTLNATAQDRSGISEIFVWLTNLFLIAQLGVLLQWVALLSLSIGRWAIALVTILVFYSCGLSLLAWVLVGYVHFAIIKRLKAAAVE